MAAGTKDQYLLLRDAPESKRLNLQHSIWKSSLGYLLHPIIPRTKPTLRIADLATGTGFWLIDLAKEVPSTCILHGFDVSAAQFPDKALFPGNISLYQQDILASFPEWALASYDIVHIRALSFAFSENQWDQCLKNAICLLKPGGHIQWDEPQQSKLIPFGLSGPESSVENMNRAQDLLLSISEKAGKNVSFGPELSRLFQQSELEDCQTEVARNDRQPELRHSLNENVLVILTSIFQAELARSVGTGQDPMSQKELDELIDGIKMEMENEKAWWTHEMYVIVGKKSEVREK